MPKRNYILWSPFLLRMVMGCGFIVHGLAKLTNGTTGFERLLVQIGVPFPHLTSWLIPGIEVLGGLAILLGLYVRIAAILLIFTMLAAMFTVQINYGFSSVKTIGLTPQGPVFGPPGYEINLLYIAGLLSLIITGAGKLSMGSLIKGKRRKDAWGNGFYR